MERDRPWTGDGEDRSFRLPQQLCQAGKVYCLGCLYSSYSIFILQKDYFILVIEIFFSLSISPILVVLYTNYHIYYSIISGYISF